MAFRFGFFSGGGGDETQEGGKVQQEEQEVKTSQKNQNKRKVDPTPVVFDNLKDFCDKHGVDEKFMDTEVYPNPNSHVPFEVFRNNSNSNNSKSKKSLLLLAYLLHFSSSFFKKSSLSKELAKVESDITNEYRGGLKVWSTTFDVVETVVRIAQLAYGKNKIEACLRNFVEERKEEEEEEEIVVVDEKKQEDQEQKQQEKNEDDDEWLQPVLKQLFELKQQAAEAREPLVVVDCGCGVGLCGTAAILCKLGDHFLFHDYNKECSTFVTAGTIRLNCDLQEEEEEEEEAKIKCAAGFGDWSEYFPVVENTSSSSSLQGIRKPLKADVILAADVSYDEESSEKFMEFANRILRPGGIAIIGTKIFYFGTNGGEEAILSRCGSNQKEKLHLLSRSENIEGEKTMQRCILALVKK